MAARWEEDWAPKLKMVVFGQSDKGSFSTIPEARDSTIMKELRSLTWLPTKSGALLPAKDCIIKGVKE